MRFFGILNMWRGWQKAFVQIAQRGIWSGWKPHKYWVFPHCMWGYIEKTRQAEGSLTVPSLYVRVYRRCYQHRQKNQGSLTVCEGISTGYRLGQIISPFPHCMWGYIDTVVLKDGTKVVPSLYVRVYRGRNTTAAPGQGSLTVCEGISLPAALTLFARLFPHCMWGYIYAGAMV